MGLSMFAGAVIGYLITDSISFVITAGLVSGGVIGGIFGGITRWNNNEEKYQKYSALQDG